MALDASGPAFPVPPAQPRYSESGDVDYGHDGMTLRDYFAAKALPATLREFYNDGEAWSGFGDVAEHCYSIADAMLKARSE